MRIGAGSLGPTAGRPKLSAELRALILQISRQNPLWGAPRIHGELLRLGFNVSQATVSRYLSRRPRDPDQRWKTFVSNHRHCVASIDFLVVPTLSFKLLFVLVVLSHQRRQIVHLPVTPNPTTAWTAQQMREAFPWDDGPRYLIHDRDRSFGKVFRKRLRIPRYNASIDIHCQPGGYHTEITDKDDVYAGALYDLGAFNYALGGQGPLNDEMGASLAAFVNRTYPDLSPERILDMGCGVGHHTLPFVDAYPAAEVHGCDLGAPMVRYAHARAEALGKPVHYSQQNAEVTDFEDESFDLITSSVLLHETSAKALRNIIAESHRLLRPGGVMAHCEVPEADKYWPDPYDRFQRDWTTHFNAEPFRTAVRETDMVALAVETGFPTGGLLETRVESEISAVLRADARLQREMVGVRR